MMKVVLAAALISLIVVSVSSFGSSDPEWDSLRVKWSYNIFSFYTFDRLPRTTSDAIDEGFVKVSDCDVTAPWRGTRYVKGGDWAVVLLFDVNGFIAGIQAGIPNNLPGGFPSQYQMPPFIADGDRYVISAYFVDPSIICTSGRTLEEFNDQGTGTNLYLQNSSMPESSYLVPKEETAIQESAAWVEGKCFYTMGNHYWPYTSDPSRCDKIFPVFLMYNRGKLNSFGWAFTTYIDSPRYEYPTPSTFGLFMKTVPSCLENRSNVTSMHIFFTSPYFNYC